MRLLSKLKIKSQITLLLIFPLLGLIYFATSIVSEKYLMAQKMDGLTNLIQFSIKVSDIIHEMQRERGVSGLFLENQGDTFATQELSQQRARTDEVIKELDQFLNLINIKDYHQDFQAELAHLDSLKRLEALREAVDTRQISEPQTIENYSKINEGLLDIIIQIASVDTHQDIFRFELAYINLLIAKEKAGLERSLLANAFVQKYFEPGQFKRFCELVAAQQVLLQRVNKLYLDQATGSFLKAKWSGKFIDETQRLRKIAYAATTDGVIENIDPNYWFKMQSGKMDILKEIAEKIANTLHDKAKHIESEVERQFMTVLIVTLIILVLAAIFVFLVSRETTASIRKTVHIAHAIAQGKLDNTIEVQATNEVGELLQAFLSMQTQLRERIEADKRIADEALRVNQALNTVSTSVFITDNHYQIIYANKAAYQLFKDNEFKIRKHLPNFDANSLVGSSIDMFHQNPHYQHQILTRLKTAHKANINIGELNMDLIITPVINAEGEHLGWVSEWNDRTAEVATEKEINHVMLAASQGDFSQRIMLENKTGFFKTLGEVLNQTLDYNQQMVDELMHVFAAIARGDLTQTITHNYAGSLEQLKNDVNATVMTLTNVMTAIQQTADAASQGDFSQRIDIKDKQGFFRALSEVLNHILDYNQQMVEDLMRVFAAIAQGDLTQTIIRNYAGTLEQLKNDVNTSIAVLTNVIDTVKQASASVNLAAEEISQGNLNLSQRTEEQAASLEQTAASMEQMTSTVQQNTDHTRQAAELATDAREQARQGGEVVNSAITAMSTINQSSKQVYDIIGVIDDIAFQTNLLALNAAVEAARAGEQGRGFAVVATEVRNLAQRSAAAAKEIKKLIQDSVNKVEEGSRLVNHSGQVLEQIVLAVRKVSDIISEIASASQEQTSGIHQVNKAVSQMEEMTQQNAALVEQSASASESMREQAEHLTKQISFFQTT